jgi:hypothetical protein
MPRAYAQFVAGAEVKYTMTWPGMDRWRPFVGLVAWLPRDYYNPGDPHLGRPVVVIKLIPGERACIVVTRTSDLTTVARGDIIHQPDPDLGCEKLGWWQAKHTYRVYFSAFDDEDVQKYTKIDDDILSRIIQAYEEQS